MVKYSFFLKEAVSARATPSTSRLTAGLDIAIICLWETSRLCIIRHTQLCLSHFANTINYSCRLSHPLHTLHQQNHSLHRLWHVLSKLRNLRNITFLQFRRHLHAASFKSLRLLQVLHLPLHALLLRWHVPFKLTALKHNQNEKKHHATAVPPPWQIWPLLTMLVRFLTALCTEVKFVNAVKAVNCSVKFLPAM